MRVMHVHCTLICTRLCVQCTQCHRDVTSAIFQPSSQYCWNCWRNVRTRTRQNLFIKIRNFHQSITATAQHSTHTHTVEPLTSLLYCQLNAAVWQNFFSSISSMVHRPFLFSSLRLDSLLSHYSIQSFRRIIFRQFLHLLPFLLPTTADCSAYSNTKLQYANAILKRTKLYRLKRSQCLREESTSSTT